MRLCTVFLLTFVISLTCVFTAPLEKRNPSPADGTGVAATSTSTAKNAAGKFAKFADQYVKPIWLSNKGPKGSKKSKKKKKSKKNDGDPAKGKSNRKGNNRRRRRNSNKNNRKRLNGFKLAFIVPLSELITRIVFYQNVIRYFGKGDFQEDRNVEDKMKIIMTWNDSDDKQIVLIEPFDTLSSNKPHKNQLTRQKRDYTSQITSTEFKPLKETLITPNEDITELGYYRNNKLNSIFKKLENNKIAGHNEFEESLWNESQIEENGLNSLENADEEIRALGLNIAKATSNPYDNVKDQDDHSSKIINTKLGVLSDESTNYIPNFEDVENETITYENSQPNLKQNELSTKNSNTNIKPLTKLSQHNNNNPKMEENTHQPPVINSKPSKNQINNNLKNNSDKLMLEEDTNSGKSFSNFPKQTEIEKQTEKIQPISNIKFDDFIQDFSVETEEMSQKNPICNDFKRNRLKETISKPKENLNDTKRNVPKTKESAQDYTNDVFKNNKPKNTMNIVEHPDIKIPNNAKNKMSKEDRIFPKFSSMHNQGLNKLDKLMDANIEDTFNDSSPDIKKSAKYNPTFNRLKDNGLQNTSKNLDESARQVPNDLKTEMSKQNNDIPRVFSTNIPEFNKIEKLENMSNLKHFKNPDDDAKDFSLETEELSIEIPFHENIKRDKSQHMMNKTRFPNISESSGSVDTNENKELPEIKHLQKLNNSKGNNKISVKLSPKIVSTSNTSKMNRVPQKSSNVPKLNENPIFRDDSLHISDFNKLEGLPQVNIPKTLSTNVDKLSDNAIQTKLEVKTSDSKLTKQNLLDTNETFKLSTPKIDNKSQVVRSDSLENKSFLNSFGNFSDELEGAIIVTTGSISSSKDHTKQKSSKIDGNRSKYDEKDFSNNPITGDVVGHRKIKNDENLERSNTIDAKPMKTINDDSNEDISNNISFNSDEDTNTNDIKKLSEANDMPINEPIFGNSKVSKKTMNNNTHNDNNKIQQSKNEIKNFEPKSNSVEDSSLPLKSIKPITEHMLKPTNNKRNSDITNMISKPKTDEPTMAVNSNPSNILSKNISLKLPNNELKATDGEIQTPINEDTSKQNYDTNQYTSNPNNDPFDSLGGESFFDSIEHLPPSGLKIAPNSGNTVLTNDDNEKPIDNEYKTKNNIPNIKFKEISSELTNDNLNIDNDQLINPAEGINNVIDDTFSPNQFNSNDFDPFNDLEDKSFLMSNEMVSNELQNVPVSENSNLNKQQIKKTDIDDKVQSFSDTTPNKDNLGGKNEDIENPTDKTHKNNNLNNLSQNSIHNPLDSNIDTSFFNSFTELSNELSSAPINENFNSSKKENEKLDTDEKNRSMLEMAANESLSSKNKNKIDDIITPKHDKPIIAANFNPSTIGSNNIPLESSNHESKAIDNEIQTPVNEDTGKQNYNINQYTPKPNNDPFDSLGGKSFFDSIEHLPPSGLEIASKSGNTILTNGNNEKPINNGYKTENNIPKTQFKEISSELSNSYLNIDNDQLINPAEGISDVINEPLSPNQFNSNSFGPINSLEESFSTLNERVSDEPHNLPIIENSDVNYNRSENNKSDESKVLPDISKKVSLTSEIKKKTSDTLNNNKTTAENYSGNPKAPHIFNSITYNPYLSNNKEYSSVDENNSQSNKKISKITSPDIKYSKEGSLSTKSNQQKTGPFISQLNPTDSVYSDGSYQDICLDDNSLPKTLDLIDEKSGADKGDLSEIFDTQHKLPSDRETINAHHVLKAEPIDHINNTDKSTKESIDELKSTLLKQKSKEISSELLNSALNTFDGKIQSPSDNNNQCKTDKPKSFEEHISNQVYDPFSSLEGESFFNPVKHLPTNKPQNLSKAENAVSMNEHNPKIIKDTTKDTPNKPKFKNNSSGLLHNDSDFITGKTNNSFDSVKDSINKSQITDQFTSKQSHDLSNSLEDKSLTFPNGIFSEEQQNVPIIDDLFLEKCQNKLPTTSEKTNVLPETYTTEPLSSKTDVKESDTLNLSDLPESKLTRTSKAQNSLNPTIVNSNVLNSHLKPINTPVDGDEKKKSEDAKNNLEKKFEEHFIDSKSDIDKGNLSGFISDTDDTKKLNKYLEKINKIINNANVSNTNLKLAQPQPNTSSNAEKKQKSIIFSPTASNHQYTNIFKNPKTNKFPSISDSGVLTNSHNQIDNTEITTLSSPHHEKPESVDLNEQKSGYNLNDLASTSIKTVYDYLSSDNKDGKLDDNTLSKTMSVNNGNNNYLTDKYDQLSENPLSQQTKEPTYRIENNPKTTISNLSNDIKNLNHFEKDTPKINSETSQVINDSLKGYIPDLIKNSSSNEKNKIYKIFNEVINNRNNIGDFFTPTLDSPVFYPTEISKKQDSNSYGFMIPKFRTKYEGGSSNDLWESIPPKQNKNFKTNNELDNFDSILKAKKIPNENYSSNNMLSSHVNNKDLNAWDGSIKSNNEPNTDRKLDINNNNEFINEYVKSLTEKLLNRMDDIDGKITKLNNFSIDNQGIADEKTDSPKIIEYLSTNTNSNGPSIKNTSIELESKQNEIIEKLDESESENESENESKIRQHKKIKHEKKSGKKRTKHKKNNREKEDSMSEIHRNDKNQKTKNRKKHSDNNNNSYYNSSNASNDVEVGKNHRKNIKTNNSNDSKDVVVKKRRKNPYENDSSYSDNISVQPEDSSRRKKKIKRKKIIYSSENDTKENYSSSIGISDKSYDSVRNLKAKDRPKKSKRTKIAEKKSTHKSHSIHSKHSNDLKDTTKNKNRKKYLDDDSSKGKTMVSKKRHVEIHSEDDETKEPKKKKKRIKKKKKKKNIDIKNIKEKDKQAMDYDSDDNKSDEYEYVTFYPKIQYTNPLSRLFM